MSNRSQSFKAVILYFIIGIIGGIVIGLPTGIILETVKSITETDHSWTLSLAATPTIFLASVGGIGGIILGLITGPVDFISKNFNNIYKKLEAEFQKKEPNYKKCKKLLDEIVNLPFSEEERKTLYEVALRYHKRNNADKTLTIIHLLHEYDIHPTEDALENAEELHSSRITDAMLEDAEEARISTQAKKPPTKKKVLKKIK
ncbi:hypothetical protein phytr_4500 [Candidatus Phycorickettsia trachydisci]|uniref:Uncharacterized protein n=1 Tax=Candidatus Phycorickettsia trachydisci TaxID=2115978 RepID=A0A2P1P801_9RICK|nr:hypothetical protein [Candidatus Phycorickettsia trachydisci]AVP87400.1 hypothetical protein phytr_4500 [Candidatus Phycorickettsia trachydisci]